MSQNVGCCYSNGCKRHFECVFLAGHSVAPDWPGSRASCVCVGGVWCVCGEGRGGDLHLNDIRDVLFLTCGEVRGCDSPPNKELKGKMYFSVRLTWPIVEWVV